MTRTSSHRLVFFIGICLLLITASPAAAQTTWYVKNTANGNNSGTSWTDAFTDLQSALANAVSGDSIFVAAGTYLPSQGLAGSANNRYKSFKLTSGLNMYGGFASDGSQIHLADRAQDSLTLLQSHATVLSGDLGVALDSSDNALHVVTALMVSNTLLDGFIIADGNANLQDSLQVDAFYVRDEYGGGLHAILSTVVLRRVVFDHNLALRGGGAAYLKSGDVNWQQCVFTQNRVHGQDGNDGHSGGGAIRFHAGAHSFQGCTFLANAAHDVQGGGALRHEHGAEPTYDDCRFRYNQATGGDGGGAVYCASGSEPTFTGCTFQFNATADQGGAFYNDSSIPILMDCLIDANHGEGGAGAMENDAQSNTRLTGCILSNNSTADNGGAIQNWRSSPVLVDCLFDGNAAGNDGGGIFNYNLCSPVMTNCIFRYNDAGVNGGAIYNRRECHPVMTNLLLHGNTCGNSGGGIYTAMSNGALCNPIATNVTITQNEAGFSGGGVFDDGEGSSRLRNSIISGNIAPVLEDVDAPTSLAMTAVFNDIVGDAFYLTGTSTPQVFTGALFVNPNLQDFHLAPGSAAISVGDSTYYASSALPDLSNITTDVEGKDRVMGWQIDLGAYEVCGDTLSPAVLISVSPTDSVMTGTQVLFTTATSDDGGAPMFQWTLNGTDIPGADSSAYQAVAGSDFFNGDVVAVRMQVDMPCSDANSTASNPITMQVAVPDTTDTTIGLRDIHSDDLRIYPNPATATLYVSWSSVSNARIRLVDMQGRVVRQYGISNDTGMQLDVTDLEPGWYLLSVQDGHGRVIGAAKPLIIHHP